MDQVTFQIYGSNGDRNVSLDNDLVFTCASDTFVAFNDSGLTCKTQAFIATRMKVECGDGR